MAVSIAAAAIGAGVGIYKIAHGAHQRNLAKKERAKLNAPFYKIQDEYLQNQHLAGTMAEGGLPAATKDYYTDESQRGLSAGIEGILGSGGNPNDIQGLLQTYDNGIDKIASADAQTHLDNIKYYMGVNKDLAGQKTIQWAINKQQPYLSTLKELSAAKSEGEAMMNSGIGDVANAGISYATGSYGGGGFGKSSTRGGTAGGGLFGSSSSGNGNNYLNEGSANDAKTNTVADPFSNSDDDYKNYLMWKNMNGKI